MCRRATGGRGRLVGALVPWGGSGVEDKRRGKLQITKRKVDFQKRVWKVEVGEATISVYPKRSMTFWNCG